MKTSMPLSSGKILLFKCIFVLFSLVLVLFLCEVGVRVWVAATDRIPITMSNAQTGWVLSPNLRNQKRVDPNGHFVMSTNADGHRLTAPVEQQQSKPNQTVILIGDSFVQGVGVDDSETFAWMLAQDTPWKIVNLGVLGYAPDQELLSLTNFLKNHPDLEVRDIIVFVFDNDFVDVQTRYAFWLGRSKPRFQVIDGRLQAEPYNLGLSDHLMDISYVYWFFNSKRGFLSEKDDPEPESGIDVVIASLEAMKEVATQRRARIHFLVHDRLRNSESLHHPVWNDYMRRSDIIDITEYIRIPAEPDPVGYDGLHWSPEGHRRVAAFLKDKLSYQNNKH